MNQTPPNSVAIAEPNPRERTAGLIGAMKDGFIDQFTYEDGLIVKRVRDSIEIRNEDGERLGGAMLVDLATVNDLLNWVEAKAELYGDNQ